MSHSVRLVMNCLFPTRHHTLPEHHLDHSRPLKDLWWRSSSPDLKARVTDYYPDQHLTLVGERRTSPLLLKLTDHFETGSNLVLLDRNNDFKVCAVFRNNPVEGTPKMVTCGRCTPGYVYKSPAVPKEEADLGLQESR
jgi:hypothetical protein